MKWKARKHKICPILLVHFPSEMNLLEMAKTKNHWFVQWYHNMIVSKYSCIFLSLWWEQNKTKRAKTEKTKKNTRTELNLTKTHNIFWKNAKKTSNKTYMHKKCKTQVVHLKNLSTQWKLIQLLIVCLEDIKAIYLLLSLTIWVTKFESELFKPQMSWYKSSWCLL